MMECVANRPKMAAHLADYQRDGFVQLSGLIESAQVEQALAEIWAHDLEHHQATPERSPEPRLNGGVNLPAVTALFGEPLLAAAEALSACSRADFHLPVEVNRITAFPTTEATPMDPHIDGALPQFDRPTFDIGFKIYVLIYLTDTGEHGGGTVLWPGSHRRILNHAHSAPERFPTLVPLYAAFDEIDLGSPIQTAPKAGDVLFFHPFCAHSGSANLEQHPRVAVRVSL